MNLIQIQGSSPTQARCGAKLPLVVGPLITAGGYALLARPSVGGPYWSTYFPAMVVLGFGMTISVAPLTAVVMSSVNQRRAGSASEINNAVSQTAALVAIAICSPLFYTSFFHSLPLYSQKASVSAQVSGLIEFRKRRLGAIQTQDSAAKSAIDASFVGAFRLITVLAGLRLGLRDLLLLSP